MSNNQIEISQNRGESTNARDVVSEAFLNEAMKDTTVKDIGSRLYLNESKEDQLPSLTLARGDKAPNALSSRIDAPEKELEDAFKELVKQGGRTIGGIAGAIAGIEAGPPGMIVGAISGYLGGEKTADQVVKLWDGLGNDTKKSVLHAIVEADTFVRNHFPWLK